MQDRRARAAPDFPDRRDLAAACRKVSSTLYVLVPESVLYSLLHIVSKHVISHRSAALLSGVNIGEREDELGEKI